MNLRGKKLISTAALCLSISATALTTPLAAQGHDPAPVRVSLEAYGARSGSSGNTMSVDVDASGSHSTEIVLAGGEAGHFGFLLLGSDKAAVRGPFETMILVAAEVILPVGRFDESGSLRVAIDLVQKIRGTVYLQSLSLSAEEASIRLSAGLGVRFVAGSVQPRLQYEGPASTAILIARAGETIRHQVLHRVYVPTTGYKLEETSRESEGGVTRIYMTLEESSHAAQVFETKRRLIDLGEDADAIVEIWIRQTTKGMPGPDPYERAARIERDF